MTVPVCRGCRARQGRVLLDLGDQPPCDAFPPATQLGPDRRHPLRMWLCDACGLAQLAEDETAPEEPLGVEPAALLAQAARAVDLAGAAGLLPAGATVLEYGSPHGGSWLPLLADRGLRPPAEGRPADVVLDCFGLMHCADQAAAVAERANRLEPGGVALFQFHSLAAIIHNGQWNALRHGHFAYYSTESLIRLLGVAGLTARSAWRFDLYGGTVLLAAARGGEPDDSVTRLLAAEAAAGVHDPDRLANLQPAASRSAATLRAWLAREADRGSVVAGYGAASRAVALLCQANIDADLLVAVADAAPAKHGRRMPGTRIPVVSPDELRAIAPDTVVLFLPDLLAEVRHLAANWALADPAPVEADPVRGQQPSVSSGSDPACTVLPR
ncbi:class I SAM-dependent methyltransferase [Solihabitans fulvus]|uniref:Class I SAM-dependent methyltransferase n=1 Tax=Solihabitans fulvus TaxID=1892852 RepID=A0A5B2XFL9_9PSEU|nr:class I SAM-dependent methyltransferase [Solihabitans fulvus]KAA2261710.1 class I SAM-dependent methyltransferase [Solihabitans fulvus]